LTGGYLENLSPAAERPLSKKKGTAESAAPWLKPKDVLLTLLAALIVLLALFLHESSFCPLRMADDAAG